jgi:hypothetical protein
MHRQHVSHVLPPCLPAAVPGILQKGNRKRSDQRRQVHIKKTQVLMPEGKSEPNGNAVELSDCEM